MSEVRQKAEAAKRTAPVLNRLSTELKNDALALMADALVKRKDEIIAANRKDLERGIAGGMTTSLLDRLELSEKRITAIADALREIMALPDPIGESLDENKRPNGLLIRKVRVPLGLIGIVYEARPNVTVDAVGLCLKSGNAVLLRGGSDALSSNMKIVEVLRGALAYSAVPVDSIQLITSTDRSSVDEMLRLNGLLDVVIPRGGKSLIDNVVQNATVPVIETGTGVCHTYIDLDADAQMAFDIAFNAKVQRPSVCNAMETLLVHQEFASHHLRPLADKLLAAGVELRGCMRTRDFVPEAREAAEADWSTEYNDYVLNIKTVDSLEEAIAHINTYGTRHSECIVTTDPDKARTFMLEVDAAAVYQNASTRFTDGNEFGFGAEIGISTQKLHARGPVGLPELTSTKFCVYGNGQIRG